MYKSLRAEIEEKRVKIIEIFQKKSDILSNLSIVTLACCHRVLPELDAPLTEMISYLNLLGRWSKKGHFNWPLLLRGPLVGPWAIEILGPCFHVAVDAYR